MNVKKNNLIKLYTLSEEWAAILQSAYFIKTNKLASLCFVYNYFQECTYFDLYFQEYVQASKYFQLLYNTALELFVCPYQSKEMQKRINTEHLYTNFDTGEIYLINDLEI